MNFIRSVLHLLWMIVTVIPWSLAAVLLSPFVSSRWLYWFCVGWLRTAVWGARWILGIRLRVSGFEHLPQGDHARAVLLAKHQSTLETFVLPAIMPNPIAYVFKREILRIPFFGWAIGRLDMIHIDRERSAEAFSLVVHQGRRLVEKGIWVTMFPEGTRMARGEVGKYRSGGTRLAIDCGVPVVPIAVSSAKCWPRKAFVKRPGTVDIVIGPPIPSAGWRANELTAEVQRWIEGEMRRIDPDAYATPS